MMKKKAPQVLDGEALQAARRAHALASSKKLYAEARKLTGMTSGQRVSVMAAAQQLSKAISKLYAYTTLPILKK